MDEIVEVLAHAQQVQALKGLAWELKKGGVGKHAAMLEATSRSAGYASWWEAMNRPRTYPVSFEKWLSRLVDAVGAEAVQGFSRDALEKWHGRIFPDLLARRPVAPRQVRPLPFGEVFVPQPPARPPVAVSYRPKRRTIVPQP
jgi:hypothetical protein